MLKDLLFFLVILGCLFYVSIRTIYQGFHGVTKKEMNLMLKKAYNQRNITGDIAFFWGIVYLFFGGFLFLIAIFLSYLLLTVPF